MKVLITIMFLFLAPAVIAQGWLANIGWNVHERETTSPDTLALRLTASCKTDYQKVRAIFNWITENIEYRVRNNSYSITDDDAPVVLDTSASLQLFYKQAAQRVLKRRVAVCEGYARLFKALCDYAGVRSEVISGYGRGDQSRISKTFRSNHSWNAVYIDSAWHLLDVTWASGYVSYNGNDFIRHYNDYYFLTPPRQFIQDHFPEDLQWSLLPDPPAIKEFYNTPFKLGAMVRYKIKSFFPAKGILEATVGDTLYFELETDDAVKQLVVTEANFADTTTISNSVPDAALSSPGSAQVNTGAVAGKKISYAYVVPSEAVSWLQVIYNGDVIMRYKLAIKKEKGTRQGWAWKNAPQE